MAVSLSTISLVAIAAAIFFAQYARQPVVPLPSFEEIRPSLYRLNYQWAMIPGAAPVPVATWLIESSTLTSSKSWVLIDTGTPVQANTDAIVDGLKAKVSTTGGKLKLILRKGCGTFTYRLPKHSVQLCERFVGAVTHAHEDHAAGLGSILEAFPEAKVGYHELAEPYITGGAQYNDLEGDHAMFNIVRKIAPPINSTLLPSAEGIALRGDSGDVASYANWMSKGVLQYHAAPGHVPGMLALHHKPTKSVIAADSFMHVSTIFPFSNTRFIAPGVPLRAFSQNMTQVKQSQLKLAAISDATTYFASHDCLNGTSAEAFKKAFAY